MEKWDLDNMTKTDILKRVLGRNVFHNIKSFFQILEDGDGQIVIYISKKCYSLYMEFESLLNKAENKIHCSNIKIPLYAEMLRGKKVILVDDVMIHGRTLNEIKKQLETYGCEVNIFVLALNKEGTLLKEDQNLTDVAKKNIMELQHIANTAKAFYQCNSYEWKILSDLIMRSMWATNTPYSATSPVVKLSAKGKDILERQREKFHCRSCPTHSTKRMGLEQYYYFMHYPSEDKSPYFCITLMKNDHCNNYKLLPAIFLRNSIFRSNKAVKSFYKLVFGNGLTECLCQDLKFDENRFSAQYQIVNSNFLIYTSGLIILNKFLKDAGISEKDYKIDHTNLRYSFGEEFEKYMEKINVEASEMNYKICMDYLMHDYESGKKLAKLEKNVYQNIFYRSGLCKNYHYKDRARKIVGLKNYIAEIRDPVNEISKELEEELNSAIYNVKELYQDSKYSDSKMASYMFCRYFKVNSMLDEENLKIDKTRLVGLPARKLINIVWKMTEYSFFDVMAAFMNQLYIGNSTVVFQNALEGYGCFCHSGEQSYKCVVHEFVIPVFFMFRYKTLFRDKEALKMSDFILWATEKTYHYYQHPFSIEDFRTYSMQEQENIYDLISLQEYCEAGEEDEIKLLVEIGYILERFVRTTEEIEEWNDDEFYREFQSHLLQQSDIYQNVDQINRILYE